MRLWCHGAFRTPVDRENSSLMKTVLRDEWGFRGMALTDFFRNNGHGFMNADAALAGGVDAMLSTFDGPENNVADRNHPTSVKQMRNACKKRDVYRSEQLGLRWQQCGRGHGDLEKRQPSAWMWFSRWGWRPWK